MAFSTSVHPKYCNSVGASFSSSTFVRYRTLSLWWTRYLDVESVRYFKSVSCSLRKCDSVHRNMKCHCIIDDNAAADARTPEKEKAHTSVEIVSSIEIHEIVRI